MTNGVFAEVKVVLFFGEGATESSDDFHPADPERFGVQAQIFISDTMTDVSDSFDLLVCSTSWLAAQRWNRLEDRRLTAMPGSVAAGASLWFMPRWDRAAFDEAVHAVCREASPGPDWATVASRIGRWIPWEFDYKHDERTNERAGLPRPGSPSK